MSDAFHAIENCFTSLNVSDGSMEAANLVDTTHDIARQLRNLAEAVYPIGAAPGADANGGYVSSLTESVMGVSAGLSAIADAINNLAAAVRERD